MYSYVYFAVGVKNHARANSLANRDASAIFIVSVRVRRPCFFVGALGIEPAGAKYSAPTD